MSVRRQNSTTKLAFAAKIVARLVVGCALVGTFLCQAKAADAPSLFENSSQTSKGGALWFIGRSQPNEDSELSTLIQETETAAVLRWHAEQLELDSFQALRLGPQRISSLLGYLSRVSVYTGFGEFYHNEPLHLSRNNGAGIETPHWFYLKVSFRL